MLPSTWSRARRQIIKAYLQKKTCLPSHASVIKVIGSELGYSMDQNGSYPFVRTVIAEYIKLGGEH